jgi:hypothetical protein
MDLVVGEVGATAKTPVSEGVLSTSGVVVSVRRAWA